MARTRKYYKVTVHRIPPYSAINGTYRYYEYVYAYSNEGALKSVLNYHKNGYGSNIPEAAIEITKEEFPGNHERESIPRE